MCDIDKSVMKENEKKKSVKARRLKDPEAPKRASSSFLLFAQEERPKIVVEMGSVLVGEMGKELGRRWSCLEGVEKDRFLQMALVDMERYKKEMEAYKPSQAFLLKKAALKKKSGGQKLTGELDKYFEFLSSHWRNISSAHPGLSAVSETPYIYKL